MPSIAQVEKALRQALGPKLIVAKGARSRGRPWNAAQGLRAHIFHHTAAPSATGSKGHPSLEWVYNRNGNMPFCNALVDRNGDYYVLAFGSCWHSGDGGPWPSRGFPQAAGPLSAMALWGVEIDDPGRRKTITAAQIESAAKAAAAIGDLCKWDDYAFVTHGDWTDAGPYLLNARGKQERPYAKTKGRKADTLRQYYSGKFWRQEVQRYRKQRVILAKPDAVMLQDLQIGLQGEQQAIVNEALSKRYNAILRDKSAWTNKSQMLFERYMHEQQLQEAEALQRLAHSHGFEVAE